MAGAAADASPIGKRRVVVCPRHSRWSQVVISALTEGLGYHSLEEGTGGGVPVVGISRDRRLDSITAYYTEARSALLSSLNGLCTPLRWPNWPALFYRNATNTDGLDPPLIPHSRFLSFTTLANVSAVVLKCLESATRSRPSLGQCWSV